MIAVLNGQPRYNWEREDRIGSSLRLGRQVSVLPGRQRSKRKDRAELNAAAGAHQLAEKG